MLFFDGRLSYILFFLEREKVTERARKSGFVLQIPLISTPEGTSLRDRLLLVPPGLSLRSAHGLFSFIR